MASDVYRENKKTPVRLAFQPGVKEGNAELKEIAHDMGCLSDDFQPSAACKFLDLPGGQSRFLLVEDG